MEFSILEPREVSRGQLTAQQILILDRALVHNGLTATSPFEIPEKVAAVCLKCGIISEAESREQRDLITRDFDLTCCGLTVTFNSTQRVLINPDNLKVVRVRGEMPVVRQN